ncbi:coiled-coil domain-containing protein 25 isoform X7 [Balaenoptera acutorostrata]|uniref:Coiled-coil domain-containing protein 25 isoform X7 n=1 Tax=Balaenoptera acutorostrata TaxID=9767 RepID=A0ABM3TPV0_BALAC|nr:coiled-coil domain-containing protein 25 isoform X7 [Balaenoptera acutorostrata]
MAGLKIFGCKMNNVNVVYTPWSNLKKTADMDVGQIGFHRQKDVKIVTVEKKVNEILNRLEKTKMERFPDLEAEKECRDREERNEKKAQIQEMKRKEKEEMKKKREMDELRSYSSLMKVENMSSNQLSRKYKSKMRASLVAQWLRICLLMQGTRVRALVWEDPTCHGAAGPVSHSC